MPAKEKTYKCLNPVGISTSIETHPLAPRLDTIEGKNICISICGEPDITIALEKKLKSAYSTVNWTVKKTYGLSPVMLSDEEIKTTHAVIQGVLW
jgi:hypothetical protein